jgi:hypothetical protein
MEKSEKFKLETFLSPHKSKIKSRKTKSSLSGKTNGFFRLTSHSLIICLFKTNFQ